jgi:cell wall-associated NlpC family hydrolase
VRRDVLRKIITGGSVVAALALLLSGCVRNPGDTQNLEQRSDTVKVRSREETLARQSMQTQIVPIRHIHHTEYVALSDLARATGYHGAWVNNGRAYGMGDHDVVWSFHIGQSALTKAGQKIIMPAPAVLDQGHLYVPVTGLQSLFGGETTTAADSANLSVLPRPVMQRAGADGARLNFSDGPALRSSSPTGRKITDLMAFAKQEVGVRYEFGAGPYESSGTFDCSSFTRQAMKHVGVNLPRSAREQARLGRTVSRDSLQPGDLLFFYVPGRFKSHAIVGDVGIYMAGGRMIHASPGPQDGVQISDLNRADWKQRFLYARRVIS